ncbi:MAG TPA: FtsX-like permease family protein, partial [Longimicrobiales bacterium]
AFGAADGAPGARVVIVDEEFVARMLRGQNAVGRRIRFFEPDEPPTDTTPWFEIVGVVPRLGMEHPANRDRGAGVYRPLELAAESDLNMIVHAPGDPLALATRIRELAVEVDPTLRIPAIQRLDQVTAGMLWVMRLWLNIMIALTGVALLLSLAGIYAVMSYTVVRRTREIGVRVALGGSPWRIITSIFRRPFRQVATGIGIGFVLVTAAAYSLAGRRPDGQPRVESEMLTLTDVGLIAVFALVMLGVCLTACVVPAMRALRVQPIEALRAE